MKKMIFNGMLLSQILWGQEPYTYIDDCTKTLIINPCFEKRKTFKLKLPNGLEAYLISDPESSQAGAVLTVQAGSWNDPPEYPGIAHFLEHLLFLGTEKYPVESDYKRFIHEHNGKSNAYTASDYTLYAFAISPNAFEEALDRFSSFFKTPLFNPSGVDRELKAIDQEFSKNLDQDPYRHHYVQKDLANPKHPFHQFNAGNKETLAKVNQETLKKWYKDNYSANKMKLIVSGPQSIDTLKTWTVDQFKDIPNSENTHSTFNNEPLMDLQYLKKMILIDPIKNTRTLSMTWVLPFTTEDFNKFNPSHLVSSILGHEGEGSLYSSLKSDHLVETLSCGAYRLGKNNFFFSVSFQLTEKGLDESYQVIDRCFQAIKMIKRQEIPLYLFNEMKQMEIIRYQYQSRKDAFEYLMDLGGLLVFEDLDEFPEHPLISKEYDPLIMKNFLNYLTPENVHIYLLAKQPKNTFSKTEPWMKVPYAINAIPSEQLQNWMTPKDNNELFLPKPNPFIPTALSLVENIGETKLVEQLPPTMLLINNEKAKVFYAKDNRFKLPQTQWFFDIKTPVLNQKDPHKVVMAELYIKCLNEALNHLTYSAQLADLSYDFSQVFNGIGMIITGYHENAETLFDVIQDHLKNCQPTEIQFELYKNALLRNYQNFQQESAIQHGLESYRQILKETYVSPQEKFFATQKITYPEFLDFLDDLFKQTYVEGLFYGNISQEQAISLTNKLLKTLSSQVYPEKDRLIEKYLTLPEKSGPFAIESSVESPSHAAILSIQGPAFSFKNRAAQQILSQAMQSAFFKTLRTQQQTGYLVHSGAEELNKHLFNYFAVQSATHDPRDLLSRYELFIEHFLQELPQQVTEESFESIRKSLIITLENSPQNLIETGPLLKLLAFKYDADFDWVKKRIQALKELTYEEFSSIAKQFFGKQNNKRVAVLIRGIPSEDFRYIMFPRVTDLCELSQYTE
ncbi:MAG: insulinase family protein [Parachlamydiaceae bacterium]|nr:insulinase family protein [Parachlamydiaceae bacterium]